MRLIMLVGEPGAGKTTAVAEATAGLSRHPMPTGDGLVARDALFNGRGDLVAVELGRQRGVFSGTDALPNDAITGAICYVEHPPEQPPLVIAEGTRLANKRFINAAIAHGHEVTIIWLNNPLAKQWRAERSKATGKKQNESWVKGRATAARNLAEHPPLYCDIIQADNPQRVAEIIRASLRDSN